MVADRLLTLEQRNARSVVQAWRDRKHESSWGETAHDDPPHVLMTFAANARAEIAAHIDQVADRLATAGFLPGHPEMRDLRGEASKMAAAADRLYRWAAALEEAHREMPAREPG